jgi:diamine N-acetyltransferase
LHPEEVIVIRQATAADAAELSRVASAAFPLACPPHTTAEAIAEFIADHFHETHFDGYLADPSRLLLVAELDGTMTGYAMLVFAEPTDTDVLAVISHYPTVELSKFYLLETAHGTGLAAELMGAAVAAGRARGALGMWLGVNQENVRANRFYEKNGFAQVGVKHFLVGDRLEDDFVRERPL